MISEYGYGSGPAPQLPEPSSTAHPYYAELERMSAADRQWFIDHPGRFYCLRFSDVSEIWEQEQQAARPSEAIALVTAVHSVPNVGRMRVFRWIGELFRKPETANEEEARAFFDICTPPGSSNYETLQKMRATSVKLGERPDREKEGKITAHYSFARRGWDHG